MCRVFSHVGLQQQSNLGCDGVGNFLHMYRRNNAVCTPGPVLKGFCIVCNLNDDDCQTHVTLKGKELLTYLFPLVLLVDPVGLQESLPRWLLRGTRWVKQEMLAAHTQGTGVYLLSFLDARTQLQHVCSQVRLLHVSKIHEHRRAPSSTVEHRRASLVPFALFVDFFDGRPGGFSAVAARNNIGQCSCIASTQQLRDRYLVAFVEVLARVKE